MNKENRFKIKISEIEELYKRIFIINDQDLNDIDFLNDNGEKIVVDQKIIDDFKFCGLNNCDFISTDFYKNGWEDECEK